MKTEKQGKKYRFLKFLMLFLTIILNGVIIFESCLPGGTSGSHSSSFTSFIADIVNAIKTPKTKTIALKSISISKTNNNFLEFDSIVKNTSSAYRIDFYPENTTEKDISYFTESKNLIVKQKDNIFNIEGNNISNDQKITFYSPKHPEIAKTISLNVINKMAPENYKIVVNDKESETIKAGESAYIDINYNGFSNREVARKYYDENLLQFDISKPNIIKIENGLIRGLNPGEVTISGLNSKNSVKIVVNENEHVNNTITDDSWCIVGDNVARVKDYDFVNKPDYGFFTQLSIDWKTNNLSDKTVQYFSSNESIAVVNRKGEVRGNKKSGEVTITAVSNADQTKKKTFKMKVVDVKATEVIFSQLPERIEEGQKVKITASFSPVNVTNLVLLADSSNTNVAKATSRGEVIYIEALKEGNVTINIKSESNPELKTSYHFHVNSKKAIPDSNLNKFNAFLRKSIGHFGAFGLSGIFTTITLFLFLKDILKGKKKYWIILISLGFGFALAGLTEIIQHFVKGRNGNFQDVLLDFCGYALFLIGLLIIYFIVILIIKLIKKLRQKKQN